MESLRRALTTTNFSGRFNDGLVSLRRYLSREQHVPNYNDVLVGVRRFFSREQHMPPSLHVNLVFVVSALINLLQVMPQGPANSPFQTHPKTINLAITSLLVYGLAYDANQRFSTTHPSPVCANIARRGMMVFGSLLLASLASIFSPCEIQPFLYVFYVFVYANHELQTWLHRRIVRELRGFENGRLPI